MSELLTIPLASIHVDKKANPRGTINKEQLQPLVDSIRLYGVLQPILVRRGAKSDPTNIDNYVLVAGQRRITAAGIAGLTSIPAVVRDTNGDTAAVALVENLQREQLTPIEEAHAFQKAIAAGTTTAELAAAISKSKDLIKARLDLLDLPDVVQKNVDTGALGLGAAAGLRALAPAGDVVVAKAAELITASRRNEYEDQVTAQDLERDPGWVLEQALEELDEKKLPFLVPFTSHRSVQLNNVPWPKGLDVAALKAKANKLPEYISSPYSRPRGDALQLTEADVDAARAYGCLVEVPSVGGTASWISDPVWLADRLGEKLDKAVAAYEKKLGRQAKVNAGATATATVDAAAAARDERAKQRKAQLAAREKNVTLGIALTKKLHAPKPTADNMRLVAELLLEYASEDLARRGTRLVDEASQTVATRKDGTISNVTYVKTSRELADMLPARLEKAKTVEQILGVLLQAIAAAHLADKKALPSSDQYGDVRGLGSYSSNARLKALAGKLVAPLKPKAKTATQAAARK